MMGDDKIFQEVDVFDLLRDVGAKNKVLNAKVLQEIEKYVKDEDDFQALRKFILDEQNSYTRSIIRLIFGDIEYLQMPRR